MTPLEAYKYCPNCGKEIDNTDKDYFQCPDCGFKAYENPRPAVNAVIEIPSKGILIVKRKRDPYKDYWDFPGGFIKPGESWQEAVKREVDEELGLKIRVGIMFSSGANNYEFSGITYPLLSMFAVASCDQEPKRVTDDVSEFRFVSREEILRVKFCWPELLGKAVKDYLALDRHFLISS